MMKSDAGAVGIVAASMQERKMGTGNKRKPPKQSIPVGAQSEICDHSVFFVPSEVFDKLMAEAESPPRPLEAAKRRFARLARKGVRP